jgi:glycosyltransferase involved in cell wall biosynthesis
MARYESMKLTEYTRANREISGAFDRSLNYSLTVFAGLYNSQEFYNLIRRNLDSQEHQDFYLVLIDNSSTDDTWSFAREIVDSRQGRAIAVRNPLNLGATGSLYANIDLSPTDWLITMHQDDFYLPDHISTLADLIDTASTTTAIVSTSMGRANVARGKLEVVPRLGWVIGENHSNIDYLLATLRNHFVPFPAAALSVSKISKFDLAWHDTSFPDSELVLKLLKDYSIIVSSKITMGYRENPNSESHSLSVKNRESGQFYALIRVFNSSEFLSVCKSVDPTLQGNFFAHAKESIAIRLTEPKLAELAQLSLANNLAIAWNYSCSAVNEFLLNKGLETAESFSNSFLSQTLSHLSPKFKKTKAQEIVAKEKIEVEPSIELKVLRFVKIKQSFFTFVIKLVARFGMRSDLSFEWKGKRTRD